MNEARIAALEARLTVAEARLEIMALEAEYARSWDAGDAEGWAAVFTPDGVFEIAPVGGMAQIVATGSAELAAFCRNIDSIYRGLHFPHLPHLTIDGDRAVGRVHFEWIGINRATDAWSGRRDAAGYYDIAYQRIDGAWRMAHRLEKAVAGTIAEQFDVYLAARPTPRPA